MFLQGQTREETLTCLLERKHFLRFSFWCQKPDKQLKSYLFCNVALLQNHLPFQMKM